MKILRCPVCGKPGGLVLLDGGPCMDCVRARQRSAMDHRCHCPRHLRQERKMQNGSRVWIACDRCLGSVRQLA